MISPYRACAAQQRPQPGCCRVGFQSSSNATRHPYPPTSLPLLAIILVSQPLLRLLFSLYNTSPWRTPNSWVRASASSRPLEECIHIKAQRMSAGSILRRFLRRDNIFFLESNYQSLKNFSLLPRGVNVHVYVYIYQCIYTVIHVYYRVYTVYYTDQVLINIVIKNLLLRWLAYTKLLCVEHLPITTFVVPFSYLSNYHSYEPQYGVLIPFYYLWVALKLTIAKRRLLPINSLVKLIQKSSIFTTRRYST